MKHICSPDCIYYPVDPNEVVKEYIDENGLKHREAIFTCIFDDHRITQFDMCENYKGIKKK